MEQRIAFVDLAKGICISLVVLWHVFGDLSVNLDVIQIMFFFRMPLYFILSGMFFKTYGGMSFFIKKKTNKLIIPFLFAFVIITVPSIFFLDKLNGINTSVNSFYEEKGRLTLGLVPSSWFLVCLFIVNFYFYSLFLLSKSHIRVISIFCVVLGILGYTMNVLDLYFPLWFDTSLTVMPFFLCGYLTRNYSNMLYKNFTKKHIAILALSLFGLLFTYYIIEHRQLVSIYFFHNNYGVKIISLYLGGISGSYFILLISKFFRHIPVLSFIGRYSIVVLLTHQPILFFIRNTFYQLGVSQAGLFSNFIIFLMILLLSLPVISFCVKFLPYCFAQKDIWR
jgi:fucose 4-O-acetylase-like acetyltransferase